MATADYNLEILRKTDSEMIEYAEAVMRLVKEIDQRPIDVEVNRIKGMYHIDHYYVRRKRHRIGVVKIFQGTFYYLGLEEDVDEEEYVPIISTIEESLGGWRITRYEASIHQRYFDTLASMGYKKEYSRMKMKLDLSKASNLDDDESIVTRTFQDRDLQHVIDMAADAYRYSIDEEVGVFSAGMASTEIPAILKGSYGEFRPDLTPMVVAEESTYIEAVCMTSISDGEPFIVLIGVRRAEQRRGYGRKLMSWVINRVIKEGYSELRLWVTVGNKPAENLYASIGFEKDCIIHSMKKQL